MAGGCHMGMAMDSCMPYLLMTVKQLCLAVLITLLHTVLDPSRSVNAIVLVAYEQLVSTVVISSLAFIFERGKRPKPSFQILCWAFFVGFLQIPLGELMLTASLRYITATFQSIGLNTIPVLVFILAVVTGRERFNFLALSGQVKLWGILISVAGATVMVVLSEPGGQGSTLTASRSQFIGRVMVALAILSTSVSSLLVEKTFLEYPAHLTLSAIMNISGTLLTVILAILVERDSSSWMIWRKGNLPIFVVLYAGIFVTGLCYSTQNWCIQKKGPVFGSAFSPLLIVFSFLLDIFVFGRAAQLQSIVAAMLVVGGLYLLLWVKSKDFKGVEKHPKEGLYAEPLLPNQV